MEPKRNETTAPAEVLIVEDSPTQAELLKSILERNGFRLSIARNGTEAIAALAQRHPTLVISDIVMPEMDGYQLCSHIKKDDKLHHIPVILLTSLSDPIDVMKGLECGADNFIFKPYDEKYLLARIAYILANRTLHDDKSMRIGVEIVFAEQRFFITSDRLQILNLLLSTYETAVKKNQELLQAQDELRVLTNSLEEKVEQRTEELRSEVEERRQTEVKLQAQLSRLNLLDQITRAIGQHQDLQSIFHVVIGTLEDNLPVDFCCVCLYDSASATLTVNSVGIRSQALALEIAMAEDARITIDEINVSRCARGKLVYEPDNANVEAPFARKLAATGLGAFVASPLLVEGNLFGVLIAARREAHSFSSGECEFLRQLSDHVALAAHEAQLHTALQQAYDDLRLTQQAIMQQERLRAVGEMASGIAHDINNALSPVALYTSSLLETEPNLSARARQNLEIIQKAVEDVAKTIARMREFYRKREPELTHAPVQLNEVLEEVMELTRIRWSDMPLQRGMVIGTAIELEDGLPPIMGSENEIRDALTNLVFNAIDAMPNGGSLTIRSGLHRRNTASAPDPERQDVCIEVADTGIGMDEDTRRRCIEPFFTTKGERGTGLGLAMVFGMTQRHGADLEIESTAGKGTVIRLIFAASDTDSTAQADAPLPVVPHLRILLVDDDPTLLKSLAEILEIDGHQVTSASGGQEGIDAFRQAHERHDNYAIVITDLGMPHIDGSKVASAVKALSPSTSVILLTGWGQRLVADGEVPPHVDRVLDKPPKLRDLRESLAYCCRKAEA